MSIAGSLFDPTGDPAASAANWLIEFLTGSVVTAICVIAVAALGMVMLTGHVSFRRGFQVILGCFLLLGAPTIATALEELGAGEGQDKIPVPQVIDLGSQPKPLPPANYDPYAGASLRRQ